jgi:hypothetical protein
VLVRSAGRLHAAGEVNDGQHDQDDDENRRDVHPASFRSSRRDFETRAAVGEQGGPVSLPETSAEILYMHVIFRGPLTLTTFYSGAGKSRLSRGFIAGACRTLPSTANREP